MESGSYKVENQSIRTTKKPMERQQFQVATNCTENKTAKLCHWSNAIHMLR